MNNSILQMDLMPGADFFAMMKAMPFEELVKNAKIAKRKLAAENETDNELALVYNKEEMELSTCAAIEEQKLEATEDTLFQESHMLEDLMDRDIESDRASLIAKESNAFQTSAPKEPYHKRMKLEISPFFYD